MFVGGDEPLENLELVFQQPHVVTPREVGFGVSPAGMPEAVVAREGQGPNQSSR